MQRASTLIQQRLTARAQPKPKAPKVAPSSTRKRQTLTENQRRYPLLRKASERIAYEVANRTGRYLRRLDSIHTSGSRTHQQLWDAVDILKDLMLARLDLATLALGWVDEKGQLHLNRQCGLAQDGNLNPCRVSRTIRSLEWATYAKRQITHRFVEGKGWVTSVAIFLTPQFFIDLGLGAELRKVQARKQKQREKLLQEAEGKRQHKKLTADAEAQVRKESHLKAHGKYQAEQRAKQQEQGISSPAQVPNHNLKALMAKRNELLFQLLENYPDWTDDQMKEVINRHYPIPIP